MNILIVGRELNAKVLASLFSSVGNSVLVPEPESLRLEFEAEPGLSELYERQLTGGRLKKFNKLDCQKFDILIFSDSQSLSTMFNYFKHNKIELKKESVVITLSPNEVGEAAHLKEQLKNIGSQVEVCSVPLLIREGHAIADVSRPENIIVGCDDREKLNIIDSLFYPFNRVKNVINHVSTREAEFSCFASHAMLATRLSFMNEMASLAEKSRVDIEVVRECIGSDPRIGKDYLYAGCGFGGDTLTENLKRVTSELSSRPDDLGLLETVSKINEKQKDLLFRKVWRFFKTDLTGKKIAIWGTAFKPGSSSVEGAPSLKIISSLLSQGAEIIAYDPLAIDSLKRHFVKERNLKTVESHEDAVLNADVLIICTEWKEFWSPDFSFLAKNLKYKAIFDGRNLYDVNQTSSYDLQYFGIGKGHVI